MLNVRLHAECEAEELNVRLQLNVRLHAECEAGSECKSSGLKATPQVC